MARLAVPVQGLRSHPLQETYRMDFVTASRAGDRFTPCRSQHAGFAMTIRTRYVIGRLAMLVQGLQSHPLQEIPHGPCCRFPSKGLLHRCPYKPALGSCHRRPFGAMTICQRWVDDPFNFHLAMGTVSNVIITSSVFCENVIIRNEDKTKV